MIGMTGYQIQMTIMKRKRIQTANDQSAEVEEVVEDDLNKSHQMNQ